MSAALIPPIVEEVLVVAGLLSGILGGGSKDTSEADRKEEYKTFVDRSFQNYIYRLSSLNPLDARRIKDDPDTRNSYESFLNYSTGVADPSPPISDVISEYTGPFDLGGFNNR